MPQLSTKLTLPEPSDLRQSCLFADDDLREAMLALEAKGVYTAERLKELDPKKYEAIIELRGYDWGQKRIARFLGVHDQTVAAIDVAAPEAIEIVRQRLSRKLRRAAEKQVDRLDEHPDAVPIGFAGDVATKLLTHAELLDGRATSRIEHVRPEEDIFEDWDHFIGQQLKPGDVIEIEAVETGLVGGKKSALRENVDRPALPVASPHEAGIDSRSLVSGDVHGADGDRPTTYPTDSRRPDKLDGRAGGANENGAAQHAKGKKSQKIFSNSEESE